MIRTHKLVFMGEPGAGKSTCISAVSQIPVISTDVGCTDELSQLKDTTTVALDYGEMDIGQGERLLLYGLPGQLRFRYMFDVVREGLLGVVVLVDGSRAHALQGLDETLVAYAGELRALPCLVAVNKLAHPPQELRQACADLLRRHELVAPVMAVDARRRADVVRMFELLFLQLQYSHHGISSEETIAWA